jgi:PPOX class probable F420-dependent enzyme
LLEGARVGHLGLLDDDDRPRVLPATFALWDGSLWSAVDAKPKAVPPDELARVRFLRRRPEAALTVDEYSDDWSRLAWVQVLGRGRIVPLEGMAGPIEALARKYEPYRESTPPGPLLQIEPRRVLHWRAGGEAPAQA